MSDHLTRLVHDAKARYAALSPEEKKLADDAQRASFIRGMTTPCEHGILDFEQCGECRVRAAPPQELSPPCDRVEVLEKAIAYMRHDGLCGIVGGYGYCTCGMSEAKDALARTALASSEGRG